jgi:uroporphyrinogen-III synthase
LRARQAAVHEVDVYRRIMPPIALGNILFQKNISIIVCTSGEGLQNLVKMLGEESRTWLQDMRLLVVSERLAVQAKALGFVKMPIIADNATDNAIVNALISWQETEHGVE